MGFQSDEAKILRRDRVWRLWLAGHKDAHTIAKLLNSDVKTIERDIEILKKTEVQRLSKEDSELAYTEAIRRTESLMARMTDLLNTAQQQAVKRVKDPQTNQDVQVMDRDWIQPLMQLQQGLMSNIKYLNELRGVGTTKKVEITAKTTSEIAITGFGDPLSLDKATSIIAELTPSSGWEAVPDEVVYPNQLEDKSDESEPR